LEQNETAGEPPAVLYEKDRATHCGHRRRLRKRFLQTAEHFEDHELLELLLFYALPRRNTNEIAHRLLTHFGSLRGVLQASPDELRAVSGIGDTSAALVRLCGTLAGRVLQEEARSAPAFKSIEQLGAFLVSRFYGSGEETLLLLLFDNAMHLLQVHTVATGTVNACAVTPRELCRQALLTNASAAVLAHNHPEGLAQPSRQDLERTMEYDAAFGAVGVPLLEHLVVAEHAYVPILCGLRNGVDGIRLPNRFSEDFLKRFYMKTEGERKRYDAP
jgi:DNA repair protein RadC